jgi:hypothetical protein
MQTSHIVRAGAALILFALALPALSSCASNPASVRATPGGVAVRSTRLGPGTKKVVAKRAPQLLLAEDGTGCDVAPDRFRDTPVGALVQCEDWREAP